MRTRQQEIIQSLGVKPEIDPTAEIRERSQYLADYLGASGMNGFVLGISGGQDSLVAGMLARRATEIRCAAGQEASFHAMPLPHGEQTDRHDALLAVRTIAPDRAHDLDIKPATDAFAQSFGEMENESISDFDKGNVKARLRMIAQYAIAGKYGLLVIGTDHAAEAVTGFFTKYGDGGADILPLSGLTKRQGRSLLEAFEVPEVFTTKVPTADLLDDAPAQSDESELKLTYDQLDDYLEGMEVSEEIAQQIEARYDGTEHKRALPRAFTD